MNRLTRTQAAVIGAFTGILVGPFADVQEYASKVMGEPIYTHELAFRADEIKEASRGDFLALVATQEDTE